MKVMENSGRITNRISHSVLLKLREAAVLTGVSFNQFMVQASLEKAESIIEREKTIHLSMNDAAMIVHLLDNPSKPNAALLRAFDRFKKTETDNGNLSTATEVLQHP